MNMKPPQRQQPAPPLPTPAVNTSPFTANENRELRRMAAGGASVAELASQFNRPASLVAYQLGKGR